MVDSTIPMSLGDSFSGYRIVGTTKAYPKLYNGMIEAGAFWEGPLEAVIGSRVATTTGLSIGDTFAGVHGLADAGQAHEDSTYKIVGTFNQTDTILDSLIVTSLESVWRVHGDHGPEGYVHENPVHEDQVNEDDQSEPHDDDHAEEAHHDHDEHHEDHDHDEQDEEHGDDEHHDEIHGEGDEITLALVKLSSPLGMMSLPREINEHSMLQAASPASEISRLLQIVGIGINWLNAFAVVLVISAAFSIFAALYTSLHARRQHLAVMRCLGATRWELFNLLLVEGLLLTTAGIIFGLTVAHGGLELVGQWLGDHQGIRITGAIWTTAETMLAGGLLIAGTLIALLPAWQAYRTDVAQTLSKA